jgi:hypothetical protein
VHAVEGAGVPDGQHQVAGGLHPGVGIAANGIHQLAGDGDVGDARRQHARHAHAGQDHHPGVDRHTELDPLAPAQQRLEREAHLHEEEVGLALPGREGAEAGRHAEPHGRGRR